MGLLGFRRDVEGLKDKVEAKKKEVEGLVTERKAIREDIQLGRTLLEVDLRSQELEERLMLSSSKSPTISDDNEGFSEATDSEDDTEDEGAGGMPTSRLQRHVQQYLYITKLSAKIGSNHPFLVNQQGRLTRLKNTVLLDLNNALRQSLKFSDQLRVMKVLGLYRDMDAPEEPTEILRTMKH